MALAESAMTLKGKYKYRTDAESMEMISDYVCFYPDLTSAKLLPRSANDARNPWFCFKNSIEAATIQFDQGDLVAYLRKENGNDFNVATVFRHLKPLS